MNYLNFFKIHQDRNYLLSVINKAEVENGFEFPTLLKTFYQTYDFSMVNKESLLCYYDKNYNTNIQFYESKYINDNHISLIKFFKPDEILDIRNSIYGSEMIIMNDFIPIGECNDQGVLLVGKTANNLDKIFIEYAHTVEKIKLINNNIFEFFQDYIIIPIEEDLQSEKKLFDLYKKWNEDFWRVE